MSDDEFSASNEETRGYRGDYSASDPSMSVPLYPSYGNSISPYALNLDQLQLSVGGGGGAEYLFPSETQPREKKGFFPRLCYGTGVPYLVGLGGGGAYGLYEGLRNPEGVTNKLRLNSVLNSVTRRGPFLGNTFGICALMFHTIDGLVIKAREGKDDVFNTVLSATASGMIFKSTSGMRAIATSGMVGAVLSVAYLGGLKLIDSLDGGGVSAISASYS